MGEGEYVASGGEKMESALAPGREERGVGWEIEEGACLHGGEDRPREKVGKAKKEGGSRPKGKMDGE